ncbi:hypothetical protein SALBM217S_10157 [Streptomyces griseoloalbus]
MAESAQYEELVRQFSAFGAVKREMNRLMPSDCPSGSAAVLTVLGRDGDMRMSRLAELLSVDMSVTSRHVAHLAERGWIERSPDPADKRSRILRLAPAGQDPARRAVPAHDTAPRRAAVRLVGRRGRPPHAADGTAGAASAAVATAARPEESGSAGIPVRGFVRGADSTPVPHAAVTLISLGGRQLGRSVAQDDGSYAVDAPRRGRTS